MACWMLSKLAAVKISGACRLVMIRVLLGGVGCDSCGRSVRSMERLGDRRLLDDAGETGGEDICIVMAAMEVVSVEEVGGEK